MKGIVGVICACLKVGILATVLGLILIACSGAPRQANSELERKRESEFQLAGLVVAPTKSGATREFKFSIPAPLFYHSNFVHDVARKPGTDLFVQSVESAEYAYPRADSATNPLFELNFWLSTYDESIFKEDSYKVGKWQQFDNRKAKILNVEKLYNADFEAIIIDREYKSPSIGARGTGGHRIWSGTAHIRPNSPGFTWLTITAILNGDDSSGIRNEIPVARKILLRVIDSVKPDKAELGLLEREK